MHPLLCRRLALLAATLLLPGLAGAQQPVEDWLADQGLKAFKNLKECQDDAFAILESLMADRLEAKLAISTALTPEERAIWQADIDALRAVRRDRVPYAGPESVRPNQYLDGFTNEEFNAIHSMNTRYGQEVNLLCESKYGDMAFTVRDGKSESQQAYEAQLRARMIEPTDVTTLPLEPLPSPFPQEAPDPNAQLAAQMATSQASLANAQANASAIAGCAAGMTSLRWKLMADKMQQRLDESSGLTAQQKADYAADIGALRRAAEQGLAQPEAVDPANAYRFMTWLSAEDQAAVGMQYGTEVAAMMASCAQG